MYIYKVLIVIGLLTIGEVLILLGWVGLGGTFPAHLSSTIVSTKGHDDNISLAQANPDNAIQADNATQREQDPTKIQKLNEMITKGNHDDSARALTKLVPDGNALVKHYDELIQIAESTTGEMNQAILQAAWGKRGFTVKPKGNDRTSAIIEWITLKSWDVKNPLDKQHLLDRFAADVQRLITSGKLPVILGLKCVQVSAFSDYVKPDPQVSLHAVVALYEGQVPNADKAMRDELWIDFTTRIGTVLPEDEMTQLYTFLKQHYPEKTFPTVPRELFYPDRHGITPEPSRISSKEYEEIVEGPLDKLHSRLRQEQCRDERTITNYGILAGERIIDEYSRNPDNVTTLVESLFSEGLMVSPICSHINISSILLGASPSNDFCIVPAPMVVSVLKSAGRNLSALSVDSLCIVNNIAKKSLSALSQKDVDQSKVLADLQVTCIDLKKHLNAEIERRRALGEYVDYIDAPSF